MIMIEFTNADIAILHGCVMHEIERVIEQRATMQDGAMVARTYSYTTKLGALRDSLQTEMEKL